jgi:hypothetical protein
VGSFRSPCEKFGKVKEVEEMIYETAVILARKNDHVVPIPPKR